MEGQQQSLAAVAGARRVVLTESALWTAHRTGLLAWLLERYQVVVPRAMLEELQSGLDELNKRVETGFGLCRMAALAWRCGNGSRETVYW